MVKSWSRRQALSALLLTWKQAASFRVGQEVCVSGYITCLDCNVGAMLPYNTHYNVFQSISHPQNHNLQCLMKSDSCTGDGYEVVTRYAIESADNKDESHEVYCRSFKLDSNSSDFLAAAGSAYYNADSNFIVQVGGFPVSFAGQITDLGDSDSSLATVSLDTDTLILNIGGCANENVPQYCVSRSGSYQLAAYPYASHTTPAPTSKTPTKSPTAQTPIDPLSVSDADAFTTTGSSVSSSSEKEPSHVESTDAFITDTDPSQVAYENIDFSSTLESTDAFVTAETDTRPSQTGATEIDSDDVSDLTSDSSTQVLPSVSMLAESESMNFTTLESEVPPTSAPETSSPPTLANSTISISISTMEIAASEGTTSDSDDRVDIIIGDVLKVDSSQEPTYMDKEEEIKELFKWHGKLAGASWGILVPLAMSAAWFRESFPVAKATGSISCGRRLCNQAWLIIHASMAVTAAIATSASVYFVVKALTKEGGVEYATQFSSPHQYMGIFLLIGAWVQVLGGIFRPRNKLTGHTKMKERNGDEENTVEHENDDFSDSATVSSASTLKQAAIIHKWRRSTNPSGETAEEECDEECLMGEPKKSTARKVWDVAHRFMAMILVICGFWQLFSGLEEYQLRYGDDSYLVTACMVWVGMFWSITFLLTCFLKKF